MKTRFFPMLALGAGLLLAGCNTEQRTDGTAGEAVSDLDDAADEGGVKADAVVIDNDAGPTVTADSDSIMTNDDSTMDQ